ncbi:MAG: YfhO family protein, partial [Candidatus Omnitrophica bacterium]|nr:YfhO family protein [Candidatus Omnitrophota bacterium]
NKGKFAIRALLLLIICIEMGYLSSITVNKRTIVSAREFKQKTGYNDHTVDALKYLSSIDKGFYRINKDYSSSPAVYGSLNDAKVQKFKGTASYLSFNQLYFIKFLQATNTIDRDNESHTRWAPGLSQCPSLHSFASIKYNITKDKKPYMLNVMYDLIATFNDVKVLKNRFFLPLGFTYDQYITFNDFKKRTIGQKQIALYEAFIINDPSDSITKELPEYSFSDTIKTYTLSDFKKAIDNRKEDTLNITEYNDNLIKGAIILRQKKMLFFSIPYDKGWKAYVDGKEQKLKLITIGFMGLLLDKGEHTIELIYFPPYVIIGFIISILALIVYFLLVFGPRPPYGIKNLFIRQKQ